MKVLVYMEDGNLCRVTPAHGYTVDDCIKDVPSGIPYKEVNNSDMPSHILRNAWTLNSNKVDIDIIKGKHIAHDIRREKRAEALADNIEIIKQDAAGIPLKDGQSAATAQAENNAYMVIDDQTQVDIDNSANEADILSALESL
jgi:hypothetical protein